MVEYLQSPFAVGAFEASLVVGHTIRREFLYWVNCLFTSLAFLLGANERHASLCF